MSAEATTASAPAPPTWWHKALRVIAVELVAYRATWRGSIFGAFIEPLLYLLALGVGLGTLVDRGVGDATLDGIDYVTYLAPALLVATGQRTAASEATWPVMAGIKWRGTYSAALATPVAVPDLVTGLIGWASIRVAMSATAFAVVAGLLGAIPLTAAPRLVGIALLVGLGTAAPLLAYTSSVRDAPALSNLYRYAILPAFLFSGTFFPLEQLPDWAAAVAWVIPLWHGVELGRAAALGFDTAWPVVAHVGALVAWCGIGGTVAVWRFRRRLTP